MQPRIACSLLAATVFACGPKAPDVTGDETLDSAAFTTTGMGGPTNAVDPTAPTQVTQSTTDDPTNVTSTVPTAATSVTVVSDVDPTFPPGPTSTGFETSSTFPDPSGDDGELCDRLGGISGVSELVIGLLTGVITDDRINAYFLRSDLDFTQLGTCIIDQLGELTGCAGVVYACKSMNAAHAGLGVSTQDFMDFAEDFVTAWDAHKVTHPDLTDEDLSVVIDVLAGMAPDIVEDAESNVTVYQRIGRKPAYQALVGHPGESGSFLDNVANDVSIVGFFDATDFDRLHTCLHRQLTSIDGPDIYGRERDGLPPDIDPGASQAAPCRDMATSHAALVDPKDQLGVEFSDFAALVTALIDAMNTAGVPVDDENIILGALDSLCPEIVTVDPGQCP